MKAHTQEIFKKSIRELELKDSVTQTLIIYGFETIRDLCNGYIIIRDVLLSNSHVKSIKDIQDNDVIEEIQRKLKQYDLYISMSRKAQEYYVTRKDSLLYKRLRYLEVFGESIFSKEICRRLEKLRYTSLIDLIETIDDESRLTKCMPTKYIVTIRERLNELGLKEHMTKPEIQQYLNTIEPALIEKRNNSKRTNRVLNSSIRILNFKDAFDESYIINSLQEQGIYTIEDLVKIKDIPIYIRNEDIKKIEKELKKYSLRLDMSELELDIYNENPESILIKDVAEINLFSSNEIRTLHKYRIYTIAKLLFSRQTSLLNVNKDLLNSLYAKLNTIGITPTMNENELIEYARKEKEANIAAQNQEVASTAKEYKTAKEALQSLQDEKGRRKQERANGKEGSLKKQPNQ